MMGDFFGTVTQFSFAMAAVTSVCVSGAALRVHECEGSRAARARVGGWIGPPLCFEVVEAIPGQKCSLFLRYQCASAPPGQKCSLFLRF